MWITTCHRFTNRAEFLTPCQTAGWTCPPGQDPELPQGVVVDIVGPTVSSAQIGEGGQLIAGEIVDPRYHVNLAWHGCELDPAFQASQVAQATPSRRWDVPAALASQRPVPPPIPARKGKAALREAGLLDAVEAAAEKASGRVRDAWDGAAEWDRGSEFLSDLAGALGLGATQVDQMFREADAIRG